MNMTEREILIEKVANILGKSVNEVAFDMPLAEQIKELVEVIERDRANK